MEQQGADVMRMRYTRLLIIFALAFVGWAQLQLRSAAQQNSELDNVAALAGQPRHISAAGVTRTGARLMTLENESPFGDASQRRLVIVADDDRAARATLAAIRWLKTQAPQGLRDQWSVSALLLAYANDATPAQKLQFPPEKGFFDHPQEPESRYAWRWVAYQAPDLVLQLRGGDSLTRGDGPANSLSAALAGGRSEIGAVPAIFALVRESDGPTILEQILTGAASTSRSALHAALAARSARDPLAIARVLANRYPQSPIVSYIPSVAWSNTLRLADLVKDDALREKVIQQTRPWVSGERPLFGERIALTAAAGTMIYADLAERGVAGAKELAVQGAEAAARVAPNGFAQHGQGWTDDMFMMGAILARSGRMPGRERDLDHLANILINYAERLQRPDGIFVHFTEGRIPWGRGNGFAALGLTEALTSIPPAHPSRARLMEIYRLQMNGLKLLQSPDGMWRQVVDEPGAYREESATAMSLTAMARGVRLGWLDQSYRPVIDRAWRGLAAHITEDGRIVDICTGTGSGPTLRFYLDRAAIHDFDDRGGAMALLAAVEFHQLSQAKK
jgi:unsaturated rhamnogalacturonyl hydrolase